MWLAPLDKPALEEALFRFLLSVREGWPQAAQPLVTEQATLRALCNEPHPDLREALRHCLDAFLVELGPDPVQWGNVQAPASVLLVALVVHNCLAMISLPAPADKGKRVDSVEEFTTALVSIIPPARERNAVLAYHAVLRGTEAVVPRLEHARARLMHAVIERSPLTALYALDVHCPVALDALAAELLPGWRSLDQSPCKVWRQDEEWLNVVENILADARLARWLRHRWLALPETREACRNLGLLLEALRRRGDQRSFILEFYDAYAYFCAQLRPDTWRGQIRVWPVLETIEKLLRTPGDNEVAIQVNRWGNEYFLKFLPLATLIIDEGGIPPDYAFLRSDFVMALRHLLDYVTYGSQQHVTFEQVTFVEKN